MLDLHLIERRPLRLHSQKLTREKGNGAGERDEENEGIDSPKRNNFHFSVFETLPEALNQTGDIFVITISVFDVSILFFDNQEVFDKS